MAILQALTQIAENSQIGLDLSVYHPRTLAQLLDPVGEYLERARTKNRRSWFPWSRESRVQRASPLLLAGPVGTGKTTLMMLLDRALPHASCAPLFEQEIVAHSSTAENGSQPLQIQVHPLSLMGPSRNIPTGVVRLRELQTFYRLFTYDRRTARIDPGAAQQFAELFRDRIVYIDEFVPDVVTSFPMQVINHLADHGVLVILSSNRHDTPFVEGVRVIPVEGKDMRHGQLGRICLPVTATEPFNRFQQLPTHSFDHIASGLEARKQLIDGKRWLYLHFNDLARTPADWLGFHRLLQRVDRLLVDQVPLFDSSRAGGADAARRFAFLIDAVYDRRCPVLLRLTNEQALSEKIEAEWFADHYLPEVLLDLERTLSRLRQLSELEAVKSFRS